MIIDCTHICTVTPAAVHQEETLSTIKFATRAKNIKNKPVINEVMDEATMLRKYKDEIHDLKKQLAQREVVIEQKVEDSSAKENELETLRARLEKIKGVFIHSSVPQPIDTLRRPKRSSRRETWCPGEAGMAPVVGGTPSSGLGLRSGDDGDSDIKADLDMELGFSYKSLDLPFSSSRKRQLSSDSAVPISSDSSFASDMQTPNKHARALSTGAAFQRAEMLLSAKKEPNTSPVQESTEVIELRKEVQRLKTAQSELQASVDVANREKLVQQQAAEQARAENDAIRHELEQMVLVAKSSYAELEDARAHIDELQGNTPEVWAEERAALEKAVSDAVNQCNAYKGALEKLESDSEMMQESLSSLQQETEALNEALSESAAETDLWKTKFNDLHTEFELAQANWMEREEELVTQQAEIQAGHGLVPLEGLQKLEQELAALTRERFLWEEKLATLATQLEEQTEFCIEKDKLLAQAQVDYEVALDSSKAKHLNLHFEFEKYCEDAEQEQRKLDNLLFESNKACDDLRFQLQNKDDDVERLTALLEEVDANRSILPEGDSSELRSTLEETRKECERLSGLLNEEVERFAALEKAHSEQLQTVEEEKANILGESEALGNECERLNTLLSEKEKEISEKDKEIERVTQLTGSTHVLQRERDQSVLCAADLREQVRTLQHRLETTLVAESNMHTEAKRSGDVIHTQLADARQEISSLSEQLHKAQHESASQIATHIAKCQSLESSLRTVTEKLDHQIATHESLQQRTREAECEAQRHLEALRSLEGNATHTTKRAQQLQTNADLSRQQCDSLSSKLAELTKENQKLEAKLSDADRHTRERIELMEASSKFKSEQAQNNAAYERQREELVRAQQQCKRLQDNLHETSHNLVATKSLAATAEEKASQALSEAQTIRRELEERDNIHRRDQILHVTQLEVKENEVQRLTAELARLQEETSEATSQVAVLRRDLSLLTTAAKDYDRLATELSQFKARYATEAGQWKDENVKLKKELKTSSSTNSSAEKERDALAREMEKLKLKLETLDAKYKQLAQTNISLESDKVTADREIKQLRKQNADLERSNEKLKTTDNKSKETQATLAQVSKTYEQLVKAHETLVKSSDKLKLDFDAKTTDLTKEIETKVHLEMLLSDSQVELDVRANSIEILTREKSEEIAKKKETDQVLLITVGKLDDTTRRLTDAEAQVHTMTTELADARKAREQAEEEKEKLCGQLTEMHYAIEENRAEWSAKEFEFAKERDTATGELNTVRADLSQREAALGELTAVVEEKSSALQAATAELETLKSAVSKLQEELTKANDDLVQTKDELDKNTTELDKTQADLLRTIQEFSTSAGMDKELLDKATEELVATKDVLKNTKESLRKAEDATSSSKQEVNELLVRVEEKSLELNATKEWIQEQSNALQRAEQDKAQLSEKLVQLKRIYEEKMQEMSGEMASRTASAESEIKMWRGRTELLDAMEKKLQEAEEEGRLWQGKIGELQGLIDTMDDEAKAMKKENAALRVQGAQAVGGKREMEELSQLREERSTLLAKFAEYREEATERERALSAEVEDYAQKLDNLVDDALEAQSIRDGQSKYQKKIKELLEKLSKAETATKRANELCSQKDQEVEALRQEVDTLKVEVNDDGTLTKQDLLSEITRLEGVVAEHKSQLEAVTRAAEKALTMNVEAARAENVRKAKQDFDSLYQVRKAVNLTPKTPLTECTNRTPLSHKENL